jgi:gamma-glutamyltranspeptidase/glutathione hydrolase
MESFYRGDIAQEIADAFGRKGGLVTAKDLAAYKARELAPYQFEWNGHTIYTPPLCATGLLVLEMISILKALKWEKMLPGPATTHARLEALRLCWKDRVDFFGDPDFVDVPVKKLLSDDHAHAHALLVEKAVHDKIPISLQLDRIESTGTLNISSADSKGNIAVVTLTHGNGWGAQVVVENLAIVLGHGMARFDPRPGRANSIAPGKRPLHNMMPSIVAKDGKPFLGIGAAGGTRIPNSLFDFFCHHIGRGVSMENAINQPRMNCVGTTHLTLEKNWPANEIKYFKEIGYSVNQGPGALVSAVQYDSTGEAHGLSRAGNPFQ